MGVLLSVSRPEAEKSFVFVYIVLACLTAAHSLYYAYSSEYLNSHSHPGISQSEYYRLHNIVPLSADHPFYAGTDHAPDQYRIGIQLPARFIADKLHLSKYYIIFTVIDFFSAVAACWILYLLLCRSQFFLDLTDTSKTLTIPLFLASLAFPLFWAASWHRPETLPTALYIAAMLLLLDVLRDRRASLLVIIAATIWQGLIRAEVPLTFGIAVLLLSFTSYGRRLFGTRLFGIACGLSITGLALVVQAYLKFWLFPHALYPPDTDIIQLYNNLAPRPLITFAVAMLPYGFMLLLAVRYARRLDALDLLAIGSSLLYLPLWITVGAIREVRIFVPFLLALTPTAAKLLLLMIRGEISSAL
jgi:hypothetical protein